MNAILSTSANNAQKGAINPIIYINMQFIILSKFSHFVNRF